MLLAVVLGGCTGSVATVQAPAPDRTEARAEPAAQVPVPRGKPRPAAARPSAAASIAAPAASTADPPAASVAAIPQADPAARPPEARPRATPDTLVGLDEPAMRRLLGEPTWTQDLPPARYWQYATRSCVLRVFFFLEMDTQRFRALSYELKSTDDAPHVDEQCFDQLLRKASSGQATLVGSL